MGRTILVVDDEPAILDLVEHRLSHDGYQVLTVADGDAAWTAIAERLPDLIILDLMLPGTSGLELLRRIRQQHTTPVILLSARNDEVDRVVGLEMGADDYVTKPFSTMELAARIKSIFRRQESRVAATELVRYGIALNPDHRWVMVHGQPIHLTATEFDILALLMQNPGRVFSRDAIFRHVWGFDVTNDTRTINVHIKNIRTKLGDAQEILETVRGVGYRSRPE